MKIEQLFQKPLARPINGVVKVQQRDNATIQQELDEYIVTKELDRHFRDFFSAYGQDESEAALTNKVGVWISGFFGSGKSHFLKILSYLLANQTVDTETGDTREAIDFFDDQKIKDAMMRADIVRAVRQPTDVILFNIDTKHASNDGRNAILNVFLRVFNEYRGFCADYPHLAHMEQHLSLQGKYEEFQRVFEKDSGSTWKRERDSYHFYEDSVIKGLQDTLQMTEIAARAWMKKAEEEQTLNLTIENFCKWVKEHLDRKGNQHKILFLVDEVGQFIGKDTQLMLSLQSITETLGTLCHGRAWVVVTSQEDIDSILGDLPGGKANDFSKIQGRFRTRLSLSSSNTDEVIQIRLLQKNDAATTELNQLFSEQALP
jgi:hypothetical protein